MKIAVYCGASVGNDGKYIACAKKIGEWLAKEGHTLVYGGGHAGLMGVLADTVLKNHGDVIGVIPEFLKNRELAHTSLTELFVVEDMHQRKKKMIDLAQCYIALPGGPGTLEEISEVISWGRIGEHRNPCILFNEKEYYNPLQHFYQRMVEEGFLTAEDFSKILFSDSLEEIKSFICSYTPPAIRSYK
ncbi:TIGR00730 family Rossman fold protein [Vagococcus entomophilus]|uniref:Cytokinin riboside 5'-monophosphate phosphoribohydrolase n=1 Tax=Vagococcus entomophilus TaxID=1160095 RepID=A0A430AKA0_9ENTE|nr:TIGR00730 family Rossman fold protein [Vagococcus entomophilus]RSU08337.1 Rossman fold protein, TIGR00730 family [Vagococcus entomophilus]